MLELTLVVLAAAAQAPCALAPLQAEIPLPAVGLVWQTDEEDTGTCPAIATADWVRRPIPDGGDLLVNATGPEGFGRYWRVTVAIDGSTKRGICLGTTTLGWRTLQAGPEARPSEFVPTPLPWTDDGDADGWPELVLWSSFRPGGESSVMGVGLNAWVYELRAEWRLSLDLELSRAWARRLAAAHRVSATNTPKGFQADRALVAQALEDFANSTCRPVLPDPSAEPKATVP